MKYAVDRSLDSKKHETADVGESLARVMKYWSVRGKFDGVHPDLQSIGVQRIEVTKDSLVFVGDNAGTNNHQNRDPNEDEDPNEVTSNDPNLEQDEDEEKTCWAWICWNCHNFCWK